MNNTDIDVTDLHEDMYTLVDGEPVQCSDADVWTCWMRDNRAARIIDRTETDDVVVSTTFFGIDTYFGARTGAPKLFETMIFGGAHDEYQVRYATRAEAIEGHARAVALAGIAS